VKSRELDKPKGGGEGMIAEIIISTMCLVLNGISTETIKSTTTFEVPAACVAMYPAGGNAGNTTVYSNGSYRICIR